MTYREIRDSFNAALDKLPRYGVRKHMKFLRPYLDKCDDGEFVKRSDVVLLINQTKVDRFIQFSSPARLPVTLENKNVTAGQLLTLLDDAYFISIGSYGPTDEIQDGEVGRDDKYRYILVGDKVGFETTKEPINH